jgi:hypothetical protein
MSYDLFTWIPGIDYYIWSVNQSAWLFNCYATEAQAMDNANSLAERYPTDCFRVAREVNRVREFCYIATKPSLKLETA